MKKIILVFVFALMSTVAFAEGGIPIDSNTQGMQIVSVNPALSEVMSVVKKCYDMTKYWLIGFYTPADAKILFSGTNPNTTEIVEPLIGNQWTYFGKNPAYPFACVTSATGGFKRGK